MSDASTDNGRLVVLRAAEPKNPELDCMIHNQLSFCGGHYAALSVLLMFLRLPDSFEKRYYVRIIKSGNPSLLSTLKRVCSRLQETIKMIESCE